MNDCIKNEQLAQALRIVVRFLETFTTNCSFFMQSFIGFACALLGVLGSCAAQSPDAVYSRDRLKPLTTFRQTHRKTVDGRLCAAAFVQNRETYTGCADAANPAGESGRPWCYVETQLLGANGGGPAWNYCAPVVDYDAMRAEAKDVFESKIGEVRGLVARLQKTQRAAEQALDLYEQHCASNS